MIRTATLVCVLATLVACGKKHTGAYDAEAPAVTAPADSVEALKSTAAAAWEMREDQAKLEEALAAYEGIVAAEPGNVDAYTQLVRGYYFLGDGHLDDEAAKLAAWDTSVAWGKKCLATNAKFKALLDKGDEDEATAARVLTEKEMPCLYWSATSLGKWGRIQGLGTILKYKPTIFAWMTMVDQLTPDYYYTAATRYWGAYYAALPSFAGQDLDKSKAMFEKAIAANPDHFGNRVLLADYWAVKTQDKATFEKQLKTVINGDPNSIPELKAEQIAEQKKAKALLARQSDLFAD